MNDHTCGDSIVDNSSSEIGIGEDSALIFRRDNGLKFVVCSMMIFNERIDVFIYIDQ